MTQAQLFEVQVGYRDEAAGKDRWIGSWTGVADSELEAQEKAHASEWSDAQGYAGLNPVYTTRVKPRFVVAEGWATSAQSNTTRWVYDRVAAKLVSAEVKTGDKWEALTESAMKDLTESVEDHEAAVCPEEFGLTEAQEVPAWAKPQAEVLIPGSLVKQVMRSRNSGRGPAA